MAKSKGYEIYRKEGSGKAELVESFPASTPLFPKSKRGGAFSDSVSGAAEKILYAAPKNVGVAVFKLEGKSKKQVWHGTRRTRTVLGE